MDAFRLYSAQFLSDCFKASRNSMLYKRANPRRFRWTILLNSLRVILYGAFVVDTFGSILDGVVETTGGAFSGRKLSFTNELILFIVYLVSLY